LRAFASEVRGHLTRSANPPDLTRYLVVLAGGEAEFDTTRARRELDWTPSASVHEAIERTCKARAVWARPLEAEAFA
jgi:nucleoside-diphosphate-sugar epimerase